MRVIILLLCLSHLILAVTTGTTGNKVNTFLGDFTYNEDWGYHEVRQGAESFWWLYEVEEEYRPLILWIQGGPGSSGVGYGNFEEIGPKLINGSDSKSTWLQLADLVFVDNPVGTGFSRVRDESFFAKDVHQIAEDLLVWLKFFLKIHPKYETRPFYIFCESYGGKMSAEFAKLIVMAQEQNELKLNFRALAMGNAFISPFDYLKSYGPFLFANSLINEMQRDKIIAQTESCEKLAEENMWTEATSCWGEEAGYIQKVTGGVSWYNIKKKTNSDDWSKRSSDDWSKRSKQSSRHNLLFTKEKEEHIRKEALNKFMNSVVREKLGIIPDDLVYEALSMKVFEYYSHDMMRPAWETVDWLLKKGTNVVVYSGSLDLICNTLGTTNWMKRLTWNEMSKFNAAKRESFKTPSAALAGYVQKHKNLQMWSILHSGHMVPWDAPEAALIMIQDVFHSFDK